MATSVKRERFLAEGQPSSGKKPRIDGDRSLVKPSPQWIANNCVVLNPADCDLDFNIEGNGLEGSGLYENGFAYCWSGARANIGITGGKYCFSCRVISDQPVDVDDIPFEQKHLCRVGISRGDDKVGNLGETEHSFGFGGTGKFSHAGKFSNYGEIFNIGDTILCAVDMESKPMASISFAKNGKWLGSAGYFDSGPYGLGVTDSPIKELHWESAVFPHVLLKNVVVELQFSCEDGLVPLDGYKPWASAVEDGKALMGPCFANVHDCELVMLVGLPASGKTTWAEKWVKEHPEKRYVLLGTNLALDQMKVPGLLRKQNYSERFDRLMDRATGIFNTLLSRASKTPRNFIIDQTNVYKSARKRKLKPFANYQKIAVVVFPRPEELKLRSEKRFREMGKEVPPEAVNEMLANYGLPMSKDMPGTNEYFDEVIYVELNKMESERCLDEMKASLRTGKSVAACSRENSVQSYGSNPVRISQEKPNSMSFRQLTPGNFAQFTPLPPYDTPAIRSQGGHLRSSFACQPIATNIHGNDQNNAKFLPRDDFNHRRSYSGYEHRAAAPVGFADSYQRNSTYGADESMEFLPGHTPSDKYQNAPVERYGGFHGGPQVDMEAPNRSTFVSSNSFGPYGTPDPRNPYGNYATNAPNYDGYPPRTRYF